MMKPILMLHTAWMRNYRGEKKDDPPIGGGSRIHIKDGGKPHAVYNFKPYRGRCYGYAPVRGKKNSGKTNSGTINISRLDKECGDKLDDVLVIWTATHPSGGRFIVGWYDGATVHRKEQTRPESKTPKEWDGPLYYNVEAQEEACRLLPVDERVFDVPKGKGYLGQSAAFYPEESPHKAWVKKIRNYVNTGYVQTKPAKRNGAAGKPVDVKFKKKVENGAVDMVEKHYIGQGYKVNSVEKDNIGWDLEARCGDVTLRLEVKGLSGKIPRVEVTPNEYEKMMEHKESYCLCIVTQAHKPKSANLRKFRYHLDDKTWVNDSDGGEKLEITERTAAGITVVGSQGKPLMSR